MPADDFFPEISPSAYPNGDQGIKWVYIPIIYDYIYSPVKSDFGAILIFSFLFVFSDSYSPLDDYFPNDGMKELEPSSTPAPNPLGPQSRDDGPQDNGILSSSPPPNGVMPTEATRT